jgi:DNA-binding NarL/FixJ family response regulator
VTIDVSNDSKPAAPPIKAAGRLRLVLVEDHVILREGLRILLKAESDLDVVGEAGTAIEGLALAKEFQPHVLITDIGLAATSGIQMIRELSRSFPAIRILVLTMHDTKDYIKATLSAGAHGYVLKDSPRTELLRAIRSVAAGQSFLCAQVSAKIVSGYLNRDDEYASSLIKLLSQRERQVLVLVARGQSNKRIAINLELSVKTIEKHRSNFMRKLKLHNTAGITMFAICSGLAFPNEVGTDGEVRRKRAAH